MKTSLTYSTAFASLEKIVAQMESDEIQVDELAEKVRQAKELIAFCENKLRMVETEIDKAIGENNSNV
ncbi:MAG TPA: exodeoxyribonuclease VII small subunit [Chitinophagales bacterium]|nr:exodeoxyribonuclease VII small subunit [Chitinophagales bacterium]